MHESQILLDHCTLLNGFGEGGGSLPGAGIDHDTAHIFVQTVDGEEFAAQLLLQRGGDFGLRVQPHGLDTDGQLPVIIENFHCGSFLNVNDSFISSISYHRGKIKKT